MDFGKVRGDFPALDEWTYLDNAFVGLMPRQVREGYDEYIDLWYRFRPPGDSTILQEWVAKAAKVRRMVAGLIHAEPEELAYTMCTGSGLNIVVNGTRWRRGDNVVFPEWEHNPLDTYTTRSHGVEPRVWRPRGGDFDVADLERLVDDRTKLVQVSQVSYINGFKMNLKEVAEVAHRHGAKLLVDATQAVGALEVDYAEDGVDYVSFAPYKYLMGPTGLAFLWVREENIAGLTPDRVGWKNQIWAGDNPEDASDKRSAEKFEYGTLNFQGIYAMEKSIEYLSRLGIGRIEKRNLGLSRHLYDKLSETGKRVWTTRPESTIVSYFQEGAVELAAKLKAKKIKVTGREAHGDHVRVSVHFYNTEDDVDRLLGEIP
ncbi:MAG TPA: aminotransferase class V-fold PLP-dependent enzyme [Candidatus Bathyarchaeia archaeon]